MKSRSGRAQSPSDMARPRTGNEDIHQPLGALLPVGTRSHVGHSDKCPKQIEWLDIFAYVAALGCALHQRLQRRARHRSERSGQRKSMMQAVEASLKRLQTVGHVLFLSIMKGRFLASEPGGGVPGG